MTPLEIKQLRADLGVNQVELARRLHVCPRSVSAWETGNAVPREYSMRALAGLRKRADRKLGPAGA